ncbi:MAG: SPOR domain-containing protein [Sphingomonadaceae bacterium]
MAAAGLGSSPALADVKAGVDAWERGDYKTAIREWRADAAKGDPDAQFNLAQAYKLGRGVERDLAMAEKLYSQAAARGHLQAADNYGLLLFQRGERAKAMPFIHAASDRGDPRAQYVLGLAYFNGDNVQKDWLRAYALVSLAQQSGLPQAAGALSQMDQHIPLEDRQKSVNLAAEIASKAEATRARQVAAADLGVTGPGVEPRPRTGSLKPFTPPSGNAGDTPQTAGADYTQTPHPRVPPLASIMQGAPKPAPKPAPAPRPAYTAPAPKPAPAPAPVRITAGDWRVQLGAFGVAGNADKLWARVKGRPELAGHGKLLVPAGRVQRLLAGGFASREDAQAACNRLKAGGFDCIVVSK